MVHVVKGPLIAAASRLGIHHLTRARNPDALLILCYHGLVAKPTEGIPTWHLLKQERLEEHLAYLTRHYRVIDLDRALQELSRGKIQSPTACITFDDGFRSNYTLGLPLLQRYRVPATIFLATGMIGTRRRLWTVRLDIALRQSCKSEIDLAALDLGTVELGSLANRVSAAQFVVQFLKRLSPDVRDPLLARLHGALECAGERDGGVFEMMTWDEARAMEESGWVRFGGHTVNHEIVSRLDDGRLEAEIAGSIDAVRAHFARPSQVFAYPNGRPEDFDARGRAAIRSAGGVAALTTLEGLNRRTTPHFELRRIVVGGETKFSEFTAATSGLKQMLSRRIIPRTTRS